MTRILLVGPEPETIDYTDPALPPGLDVVKVRAGLALAAATLAQRGWQMDICLLPPDGTAAAMLQAQLAGTEYQCVVIGTGLRLPPKNLLLFELAINIIHKTAPNAAIAFNTGPVQTSDAAARWVLERK
jgi:hypothetical protein